MAKSDDSRISLLQSFNYAFEGIIHVVRTQRNMKIHLGLAIIVLVAAFFFDLDRLSIVALFVAISFVFITEMLNTALEYAIDIFTSRYDPLAKLAKDVAAGAVLVATLNALVVAYLVFYDRVAGVPYTVLNRVRQTPIDVAAIAVFLLVVVVIAVKALTGRGTPLRGGLPSGHAAVAFGGWVAVTFIASGTRLRPADLGDRPGHGRADRAEPRAGRHPHLARGGPRRAARRRPDGARSFGCSIRCTRDRGEHGRDDRSGGRPAPPSGGSGCGRAAAAQAYAPYSGLCVGAALVTAAGATFTGVNVENASYPVGLCAERAALAAAVTAGERRFAALAVATDPGRRSCPAAPACRRSPSSARSTSSWRRRPPAGGPRTRAADEPRRAAGRRSSDLLRAPFRCRARRRDGPVSFRLRRGAGAPERRQVDARQPARGTQGEHRVGPSPDHAAAHQRRRDRRDFQLVLLDLPGFQRPFDSLTRRMQATVDATLTEVDAALFMLNAAEAPGGGDRYIARAVASARTPTSPC